MFGKTFLLLMGVIAVGLLIDGWRTGGVYAVMLLTSVVVLMVAE